MHPDQNKKKGNAWTLAGIAVGIAAMVIGLVFLFGFKDETFYGSTVRLGTAFFNETATTEIYTSTTFAANALKDIYEMLSTCFGVLFLLLGAIDLCAFGSRLQPKQKAAAVPAAGPVPVPTAPASPGPSAPERPEEGDDQPL
mgnify:CR=1 FL=1